MGGMTPAALVAEAHRAPLVSVVVPMYNAAAYLGESLVSFAAQTYGNIEFVLVDDGSTDATLDIAKAWCAEDRNFRAVYSKSNGGASSARNYGLRCATGEYIAFWDADDGQAPNMVAHMVAMLEDDDNADVAVCALERVHADGSSEVLFGGRDGRFTAEEALRAWFGRGMSTGPYSKLCRRGYLLSNDIMFEEGIINEDVMWTAELLAAARSVRVTGAPLYRYFAREGSVSGSFGPRQMDVFYECQRIEAFISGRFPKLVHECGAYCARSCWNVALAASRGGNKATYPDLYRRARRELYHRLPAVVRTCKGPKNRVLQALVLTGLYGCVKK